MEELELLKSFNLLIIGTIFFLPNFKSNWNIMRKLLKAY